MDVKNTTKNLFEFVFILFQILAASTLFSALLLFGSILFSATIYFSIVALSIIFTITIGFDPSIVNQQFILTVIVAFLPTFLIKPDVGSGFKMRVVTVLTGHIAGFILGFGLVSFLGLLTSLDWLMLSRIEVSYILSLMLGLHCTYTPEVNSSVERNLLYIKRKVGLFLKLIGEYLS